MNAPEKIAGIVHKTTCECYEVRKGFEWSTITLRCWEHLGRASFGGEIVINGTLGTWGNTWNACAVPFKQFLTECGFDYIFTKFMGTKLEVFDVEATTDAVHHEIIRRRRGHDLTKEQAREAWDLLDANLTWSSDDSHGFGEAMQNVAQDLGSEHPLHDDFADPMSWPTRSKPDCQATGFWEQLWPLFIAELKKEIEGS